MEEKHIWGLPSRTSFRDGLQLPAAQGGTFLKTPNFALTSNTQPDNKGQGQGQGKLKGLPFTTMLGGRDAGAQDQALHGLSQGSRSFNV